MQSGSVNRTPGSVNSSVGQRHEREVKNERPGMEPNQVPGSEEQPEPEEKVTLAARFKVGQSALQAETQEDGNQRSEMTIALVPQKDKEDLQARGVVFPDLEEVRSDAGLDPDGRLELFPVNGTGNPETTNIVEALEVPKTLLEVDPNTGTAPIQGYVARLIPQGADVLPEGHFAVPDGTQVAPSGYQFDLATSEAGAKTEKKRMRLNSIADTVGTFSQSSLVGLFNIPYFSPLAPIFALGTAGLTYNQHMGNLKTIQDTLGYVESREKQSKTDKITLELGVGHEIPVSAESEKIRLNTQVRQTKAKLTSNSLMAAAGASSVIGLMANAGVLGSGGAMAALTAAGAATPYLAGAAMIAGSGGMVLDSMDRLKQLSKEKAELQKLAEGGQTHVLRTIERMDPNYKRPVAVNEAEVPIEERLKQIGKEQRKHRLLATAMTGGMGAIGGTVALGAGGLLMAPIALAPAAAVGAAQSLGQLHTLSKEKKELTELQDQGQTMVPRQVEQGDGSWQEERVPISNLLSDIKKESNKHKLILTAVGTTAAAFGMTLGAGMSVAAAAPLVLVPAIVGAALFPDKVKEFTEKVFGYLKGKFGQEGSSRKEVLGQTKELGARTIEKNKELTASLRETAPHLFSTRSKFDLKGKTSDGYMTALDQVVSDYAKASTSSSRHEELKKLDQLLGMAPPEVQPHLKGLQANLLEMKMETEAAWTARDIALELETPRTKKMLADDRVKDRVQELGFPTDSLKDQYKESLEIENDDHRLNSLIERAQGGDQDANRVYARTQVFSAARNVYQSEEELGGKLYTRLLDALSQPDDAEGLELVTKEIAYKLGVPVQPEQLAGLSQAIATLETPINLETPAAQSPAAKAEVALQQLASVDPENAAKLQEIDAQLSNPATFEGMTAQEALAQRTKLNASYQAAKRAFTGESRELANTWETNRREARQNPEVASVPPAVPKAPLQGSEQRMTLAYREMHKADPESTDRLGQAFAQLNDPQFYDGLSMEQAQQKKMEAATQLTQAKEILSKSAPEALQMWDTARQEVEENYFQRSVDQEFKDAVLARPEVAEAVDRLSLEPEAAESLYLALLRSQVLGDPRSLQSQLADDSGKQVDPAKGELLEVLDRSILSVSAERSGGGAEQLGAASASLEPAEDPRVQEHLQTNPVIQETFESEGFQQLAQHMQIDPEQMKEHYLKLLQVGKDPAAAADFHGRLEGGDVAARQMLEVAQAVDQLILSSVRRDPEVIQAEVDQAMAGPVVQTVLAHEEIEGQARRLQVDSQAVMRTLLTAELSADPSILSDLHHRASQGDTVARSEFEMSQILAQALMHVSAQAANDGQPPLPTAA